MRSFVAALVVAIAAQNAFAFEECIAAKNDRAAVAATYGGKTYRLKNEACRSQFMTDPERYSQLYDAIRELEAEGTPIAAPATPSLVPS